jgi:hypothetical protein
MFRLIKVKFLENFVIAQNHYSLKSSILESISVKQTIPE